MAEVTKLEDLSSARMHSIGRMQIFEFSGKDLKWSCLILTSLLELLVSNETLKFRFTVCESQRWHLSAPLVWRNVLKTILNGIS